MIEEDQDFTEKRDFNQMYINVSINFAITGNDLSRSGILFNSDVKLHPITQVRKV